jgi:hypothetical protein
MRKSKSLSLTIANVYEAGGSFHLIIPKEQAKKAGIKGKTPVFCLQKEPNADVSQKDWDITIRPVTRGL